MGKLTASELIEAVALDLVFGEQSQRTRNFLEGGDIGVLTSNFQWQNHHHRREATWCTSVVCVAVIMQEAIWTHVLVDGEGGRVVVKRLLLKWGRHDEGVEFDTGNDQVA